MVLVFLGIMNYLIDAYTIFAASVLAANSVLRSLFGAIFPLFTTYMYNGLGIHWASSVPGFLALACVPFPFLFYKYGSAIRVRCKYAAEADRFLKKMRGELPDEKDQDESSSSQEGDDESEKNQHNTNAAGASAGHRPERDNKLEREHEQVREQEAFDYSYDDESKQPGNYESRFQSIKAPGEQDSWALRKQGSRATSVMSTASTGHYEGNPYDLDRTNTRESFRPRSQRSSSQASNMKEKVLNGLRFK